MPKRFPEAVALITCLSLLPLMVGVAGCAGEQANPGTSHRFEENLPAALGYSQSTARRIEDARTAERVREALAAGSDYRYDGVKVAVSASVVQLNGSVKTGAQKNLAGEIASKVVGVKSIENNLTERD